MESNTNSMAPANARPLGFGTENNQTHSHHHHKHIQPHDNPHHLTLSLHSIIIIIVSIISFIVLFALALVILVLRRLKSGKGQGSCNDIIDKSGCSRFIAHTTINLASSPGNLTLLMFKYFPSCFHENYFPLCLSSSSLQRLIWVCLKIVSDVKGGCLYGGHLKSVASNRYKGVQVFTYKELEFATEKFSEANVLSNGKFGAVYKGVLSDGTLAAIKRLHREGKQGERAFRMEVNEADFIYYLLFSLALYLFLLNFFSFLFTYMSRQKRPVILFTNECNAAIDN